MALIFADRVKEFTTTTGTGTVTLGGAATGYQSFAAIGNGNTTYYTIAGQGTSEWEVGIGTYTSSGTTLSRDTVLSSSNSGSKVNFSAGTKDVFVTYPAEKSVNYDASGVVNLGSGTPLGGATNPIVSMAKGATGYVQSYIVNNTNGASSSADIVAYPSNGTDSHGWVDMGITSLSYADTTYTVTGPNESYLFASAPSGSSTTGNLVIATDNTGTANSIQFYTNGFTQAKSAAKMVIDGSTGNVGIGTSSPSIVGSYKILDVRGTGGGLLNLGTGSSAGGYIYNDGTNMGVYNNQNGVLDFGTNAALRARIDSSGNLLVGTTSASETSGAGVKITPDSGSGDLGVFTVSAASTSARASNVMYSTGATAYRFYVDWGGTVHATSTSIAAISDATLKTNVKDLETGIAEVMALKPRRFDWVNGDGTNVAGFIAQEVAEVLPELVVDSLYSKDEEGNPITKKNLKMGDILPTLVKAVQEQQAIIEQLRADVAQLKGQQ
jgi:hypothetical protein